jgi:hypothetical protein
VAPGRFEAPQTVPTGDYQVTLTLKGGTETGLEENRSRRSRSPSGPTLSTTPSTQSG